MKTRKLIPALVLGCSISAQAGTYDPTYSSGFANSGDIPIGNTAGWSDSETVTSSEVSGTISSITVNLDITGGYNGNLYGYLEYDGVLVTLLNRVGVSSSSAFGYSDSGFNITFSSTAANNIHSYQNYSPIYGSGQLTGTWAPDGNTISPISPAADFNANPGGTGLTSFNGLNPDGTWTLFLADVVSGGGQAQVASYGVDITTVPVAVPEPGGLLSAGLFLLGILLRKDRARKGGHSA
jgi:hypothetical protein